MEELISIIIPVYNAELYLKTCLESVVNQSYKNLEIICVDDGSNDSSLKILNEYAENDERFIILHKENEGVSLARNLALEKVSGDYIMFVDCDDWIDADTLETAVVTIKKNEADIVMWSYVRELGDESAAKVIFDSDVYFNSEDVKEKLHRRMVGPYGEETSKPENADALCTVWGKLYKSSLIIENDVKFYDIREIGTYEDGIFNLSVFSKVNSAVFINRCMNHYRRNNDSSLTTFYNPKLTKQWDKLFDIIERYIDENEEDETFKTALSNRIVFSLIALGINETEKHDSFFNTLKSIGNLTNDLRYRENIKKLDLHYLPIHWKLFFIFAKYRLNFGVYLLLLIIQKIRGR